MENAQRKNIMENAIREHTISKNTREDEVE